MTARKDFIYEETNFHLQRKKNFSALIEGNFCTITRKASKEEKFLHKFNLTNFLIYRELVLVRFLSFLLLPQIDGVQEINRYCVKKLIGIR
jgi:hypothetical protein